MMTLDKENSNESNERLLQLVGIENPGVNDVPMGRGGFVNSHPGHRQYMRMVRGRKLDYVSCEKSEKIKIAWSIVRDLRSLDPPARFLRKDRATGLWYDVGDKKFREKVSQALREHQPLLKAVIDLEDLGSDIWESNGRDTQLEPILEQRQSLTPPATLRLPCDSEQRRMAFASSRVELSSMLHVTDMSGCDGFRDEGSLNLSDFTHEERFSSALQRDTSSTNQAGVCGRIWPKHEEPKRCSVEDAPGLQGPEAAETGMFLGSLGSNFLFESSDEPEMMILG
ncbi:expressed unknown protein [Seminavis robusta]|uniref:DUF6824 domain-containing protein n=1 Tax=Seminavis robusta TaxID=568900 RepID=A0A9N8H2T1_9STRA|nr:expressed unknown protein [Seminavis robusta]|eukprot:Sro24_g016410.1 n/a (282) ;mRNA; f:67085-68284